MCSRFVPHRDIRKLLYNLFLRWETIEIPTGNTCFFFFFFCELLLLEKFVAGIGWSLMKINRWFLEACGETEGFIFALCSSFPNFAIDLEIDEILPSEFPRWRSNLHQTTNNRLELTRVVPQKSHSSITLGIIKRNTEGSSPFPSPLLQTIYHRNSSA